MLLSASGGAGKEDWGADGLGVSSGAVGVADVDVEEMDCEERWGDDGEVFMDLDLSEVQQEQLITEISETRNTLLPATTLDSFSLSSSSPDTPLNQVGVQHQRVSLWSLPQTHCFAYIIWQLAGV